MHAWKTKGKGKTAKHKPKAKAQAGKQEVAVRILSVKTQIGRSKFQVLDMVRINRAIYSALSVTLESSSIKTQMRPKKKCYANKHSARNGRKRNMFCPEEFHQVSYPTEHSRGNWEQLGDWVNEAKLETTWCNKKWKAAKNSGLGLKDPKIPESAAIS